MASRRTIDSQWELPLFREAHQLSDFRGDFYSVNFYPFTKPGDDPIFALVGGRNIIICRLTSAGKGQHEIINHMEDEDEAEDFFTCTWARSTENGAPLLCVAGEGALIKIINALTGKLITTFTGHGGAVNDLAVSPICPYILASASDDQTVRIWSLDPTHKDNPCAAILEGDGHRDKVLTIAFHDNGRYLLSGGGDTAVNLWVLPVLPDENTGTSMPTRIHYPHFSTQEIHRYIVDCVQFHGDLIISKCDRELTIVFWSISNFSSTDPIPPTSSAPTTHETTSSTRSAFSPPALTDSAPPQYNRLLQLSIPDSGLVWMRFSLFPGDEERDKNPVLAFCNSNSKLYFWDLKRLGEYYAATSEDAPENQSLMDPTLRPKFMNPFQRRQRVWPWPAKKGGVRPTSPTESSNSQRSLSEMPAGTAGAAKGDGKNIDWHKSIKGWEKKYKVGDPAVELEAHKEEMCRGVGFCGRKVAWSNDGAWCVVAGSGGVWAVLQRWGGSSN